MEASPTVVPKSMAICGSSESVTRTIAWLAKPATASSTMERVGTFSGDDRADTRDVIRRHSAARAAQASLRGRRKLGCVCQRARNP